MTDCRFKSRKIIRHQRVGTDVGIGGIMSATDVVEFLLAGATAVQVGTASFVTPGIAQTIAEDLEQWMQANGVHDVRELIGGAQRV